MYSARCAFLRNDPALPETCFDRRPEPAPVGALPSISAGGSQQKGVLKRPLIFNQLGLVALESFPPSAAATLSSAGMSTPGLFKQIRKSQKYRSAPSASLWRNS